ncbi:hypothetical protein C0J52_13287 [Blattella germanica]|nr:hypothetical protein C0J52_13287 [Blattella germanica]
MFMTSFYNIGLQKSSEFNKTVQFHHSFPDHIILYYSSNRQIYELTSSRIPFPKINLSIVIETGPKTRMHTGRNLRSAAYFSQS